MWTQYSPLVSRRLFSSVLEMALSSWRAQMRAEGLSLEDNLKPLLDLRFVDDTLLFSLKSKWDRFDQDRFSKSKTLLKTKIKKKKTLIFRFASWGSSLYFLLSAFETRPPLLKVSFSVLSLKFRTFFLHIFCQENDWKKIAKHSK